VHPLASWLRFSIAKALLAPFGMTNMLRMMFEHPQAKAIFGDWDAVAARAVHAVRLNAATYPDAPRSRRWSMICCRGRPSSARSGRSRRRAA
jgi:hypothetical protein